MQTEMSGRVETDVNPDADDYCKVKVETGNRIRVWRLLVSKTGSSFNSAVDFDTAKKFRIYKKHDDLWVSQILQFYIYADGVGTS